MEKTDIGILAHSDINRKNPCFLCSRLRRKRIFEIAAAEGCNKIAFAHHRDDINRDTAYQHVLRRGNKHHDAPTRKYSGGKLHIIRPLCYLREELVKKYSRERQFPVVKKRLPDKQNIQTVLHQESSERTGER